jgi:hypothetical protein
VEAADRKAAALTAQAQLVKDLPAVVLYMRQVVVVVVLVAAHKHWE